MAVKVNRPVLAAISAAVLSYIKAQEAAQELAALSAPREVAHTVSISQWSASGRQATMEMRRLLQLRMIS